MHSPGRKIRDARINLGLTQEALTRVLNEKLPSNDIVERSMVSRWEKDLHFPRTTRKDALEEVLGISIDKISYTHKASAQFIPQQEQIFSRLAYGLAECEELWITSANSYSGVWQNISEFNKQFEKLRKSKHCLVKEIYYIQTLDDLKKVKQLAQAKYPNYRLSVRIAPGQPIPIVHIPRKQFGVILSGFGDDWRNVGLELDGRLASFSEHTFRYRWIYSTKVVGEDGRIMNDALKEMNRLIKELGGSTQKYFGVYI